MQGLSVFKYLFASFATHDLAVKSDILALFAVVVEDNHRLVDELKMYAALLHSTPGVPDLVHSNRT